MKRFNEGALSALERRALAWIAHRLPATISPDHLTSIGIIGSIVSALGYIASRNSLAWLWVATLGILINWAGDSLDGTVARLRGIERSRYGFFVDHTSDLFGQSLLFIAIGCSPCARLQVACLALIAFLMAFVYSMICMQVRKTLRITYFGFGPTEIRALLIAGNLITLHWGLVNVAPWFGVPGIAGHLTIFEPVMLGLSVLSVPMLALLALAERARLNEDDPPRLQAAQSASMAEPSTG